MEKWKKLQLEDFLLEERTDCYWFWSKGKIKKTRYNWRRWLDGVEMDQCVMTEINQVGEWNGLRFKNGFYNLLDILIIKYMGIYNGQTKQEFQKNYTRVRDIVTKSNGDVDKAVSLAKTQANRITDEWKAINRAMAARETSKATIAEEKVYEAIFEVFFQRAYELGSVSKQDYRNYKLEKLGI